MRTAAEDGCGNAPVLEASKLAPQGSPGSRAPELRFAGHHPAGAGLRPQEAEPQPEPRCSPRGKALRVTRSARRSRTGAGGRASRAPRTEPTHRPEGPHEGNPDWTIGAAAAGGSGHYQPVCGGGRRWPVPAAARPREGERRRCQRHRQRRRRLRRRTTLRRETG